MDKARRQFFRIAGDAVGAAVLTCALPRLARADDLPHLSLDDPTGKALNYTEDASKAPALHVAGQQCSNCNLYSGKPNSYGPCQLFAGKSVNANGWCSGWAKET